MNVYNCYFQIIPCNVSNIKDAAILGLFGEIYKYFIYKLKNVEIKKEEFYILSLKDIERIINEIEDLPHKLINKGYNILDEKAKLLNILDNKIGFFIDMKAKLDGFDATEYNDGVILDIVVELEYLLSGVIKKELKCYGCFNLECIKICKTFINNFTFENSSFSIKSSKNEDE